MNRRILTRDTRGPRVHERRISREHASECGQIAVDDRLGRVFEAMHR